jgi:vancomycin resistance protein VanJ
MTRRLFWRQLILGIFICYSLSILVLFILRTLIVEWHPWLTLLSSFMPMMFVPVPFVVLIAWQFRSRLVFFLSLGVIGVFVILYGSLFLPHSVASASGTNSLTVVTFNLGPGQADPNQIVSEIASTNADIIAVQEMTPETASLLSERLRDSHPYKILDVKNHSTGLLSRYPIVSSEWFQPAGEGRSALYLTLNINDANLHVFAPHPFPSGTIWLDDYPIPVGIDDDAQQRQLADLAQRAREIGNRVIVMGDLNVSDQTHAYPELANVLGDAYREAGWGFGFTFPNGLRLANVFPSRGRLASLPLPGPFLRLDYVFHSYDLIAEKAEVVCRGGSDHCYLMATLGLK